MSVLWVRGWDQAWSRCVYVKVICLIVYFLQNGCKTPIIIIAERWACSDVVPMFGRLWYHRDAVYHMTIPMKVWGKTSVNGGNSILVLINYLIPQRQWQLNKPFSINHSNLPAALWTGLVRWKEREGPMRRRSALFFFVNKRLYASNVSNWRLLNPTLLCANTSTPSLKGK